jgi:hypothetical protein
MATFRFKSAEAIPPGQYLAKFVGVEETEHAEFGPGLAWKFQILEGPEHGRTVSRVTAPEPTEKNSCGKMIRALAGSRKVTEVDSDEFVGQHYQILVGENAAGTSTRVESALPAPRLARQTADNADNQGIPF